METQWICMQDVFQASKTLLHGGSWEKWQLMTEELSLGTKSRLASVYIHSCTWSVPPKLGHPISGLTQVSDSFFTVLSNCSGTTQLESSITPLLWITGGSKTLQSNSISAAFLLPVDPDVHGVSLETDTFLWCQIPLGGFQRCARGARMLVLFRSPRHGFSHSQTALSF